MMNGLSPELKAYRTNAIRQAHLHYHDVNERYKALVLCDLQPQHRLHSRYDVGRVGQLYKNKSFALEVSDCTEDVVRYLLQPQHEAKISYYYRADDDIAFEENRRYYAELGYKVAKGQPLSDPGAVHHALQMKKLFRQKSAAPQYITLEDARNVDCLAIRWKADQFMPSTGPVRSYYKLLRFSYNEL